MFDTEVNIETKEIANALALLAAGSLSIDNIRAIKDRDGVVHTVQMGLFSHTVSCDDGGSIWGQEQAHTRIELLNGARIVVALTTEEVAKKLNLSVEGAE
jgi:hypothetical protein